MRPQVINRSIADIGAVGEHSIIAPIVNAPTAKHHTSLQILTHIHGHSVGFLNVDNLRPICAVCNNSMGTTDMKVFAFDNFNVEL